MDAGLSSDCRCPHTHLTLKQSDPYYCQASDGSEMKRLNTVFFSPEKLVGSDDSTRWAGPDSGNFTLTVDLQNTYQVRTVFCLQGSAHSICYYTEMHCFKASCKSSKKTPLK